MDAKNSIPKTETKNNNFFTSTQFFCESKPRANTLAQAEQIAKLTSAQTEAQAEISAQITRLISAQAEILATRGVSGDPNAPGVEGLDEFTDAERTV